MLADMTYRLRGFGLSSKIALADTLGAAHALAGFGIGAGQNSVIASPGAGRTALRNLPVEGLRLEDPAVMLLKRLGLRRIGQLYDIPRESLERRFSDGARRSRSARGAGAQAAHTTQAVLWRLDQALGLIKEPRAPMSEPARFTARRDYPDLLVSSEVLVNEIERLVTDLTSKLAAAGRGVRRLHLCVYRADGTHAQITIGTSFPSRDPAHIMRLIREKINGLDVGFGVDVLILQALDVEPLNETQGALSASASSNLLRPGPGPGSGAIPDPGQRAQNGRLNAAAPLLDALINRIGPARVFSLKLAQSHDPERRQILRAPLSALPTRLSRAPDNQNDSFHQLRPCLLLRRPEPILVIAPLPGGPPAQFVWRRMTRRIVRAGGPERIGAEWWRHLPRPGGTQTGTDGTDGTGANGSAGTVLREAGSSEARQVAEEAKAPLPDAMSLAAGPLRDYYFVEDQQGARYWLFRLWRSQSEITRETNDGKAVKDIGVGAIGTPRWYVHGVFA